MSSWGNYDNAANAPLWAVNSTIVKNNPTRSAPTSANVELLYANTTANVYVAGETIGLFGVDSQETAVNKKVAHAGWVLKTTGQGGRAGRVQQETLVALSSMNGTTEDGDAQVYANVSISLVSPTSTTVRSNAAFANVATLTVTPTLTGNTAARLTYTWQYNTADGSLGWTSLPADNANTHYTGKTSSSLGVVPADNTANSRVYRVTVAAADQGVTSTSSNATVIIY